ncbi:MAG: hypothetical protein IKD03_00325 [Clostridia bacterium]|nr:hypothetical protein [Clostridia bacterium]
MTAVFTEKEKKESYATKKKMWILWFVTLGVYLAILATMITLNVVDIVSSRDRRFQMPFMIGSILLSVLYWSGTLFFFSIKFRLTSKYCKIFTEMKRGLKDRTSGKFVGIDPEIVEKEGVYFYTMVMQCAPLRRGDITQRNVLVERNHTLPPFAIGETVEIVTHANILMAYERKGFPESEIKIEDDE